MTIRAIKIDAEAKRVYEIQMETGLQGIYKAVGCKCFESVYIKKNSNAKFEDVLIDEEGLFKEYEYGFSIESYDRDYVLSGNGVVIGADPGTGEFIDSACSVEEIRKEVSFFTLITAPRH